MLKLPENKRFFRIGEVSRLLEIKPYVLRFWESEFSLLRPNRADSKQRIYEKEDIALLLEIKTLLHSERLTIEGAKKRLEPKYNKNSIKKQPDMSSEEIIKELKKAVELLS